MFQPPFLLPEKTCILIFHVVGGSAPWQIFTHKRTATCKHQSVSTIMQACVGTVTGNFLVTGSQMAFLVADVAARNSLF